MANTRIDRLVPAFSAVRSLVLWLMADRLHLPDHRRHDPPDGHQRRVASTLGQETWIKLPKKNNKIWIRQRPTVIVRGLPRSPLPALSLLSKEIAGMNTRW